MVLDVIVIIFCLLVIIFINIAYYDTHRFVIKDYTIKSSKIDKDVDFLFVSDLHSQEYGKDNEKLIKAIDTLKVDGALLAGDIMTAKGKVNNNPAIRFVNELSKRMPVYYGIGNHELRFKNNPDTKEAYQNYVAALADVNLKILDNYSAELNDVIITGLSIEHFLYDRSININMPKGYMKKMVGDMDTSKFNILIAHNPEYFDEYCNHGADLILAGHYHGGIMRLPKIGGVISPRLKLFPKICVGEYTKDKSTMFVSAGLGMHSHSFRVFNPAELIVIHLKKD